MANTIRRVEWSIESAQGSVAGFLEWPRWAGFPGDQQLNELLNQTIRDADLVGQFEGAFISTDPRWFGLWIDSPLTAAQCSLLQRSLSGMGEEVKRRLFAWLEGKQREHPTEFTSEYVADYQEAIEEDHRNLAEFLAALKAGQEPGVILHVSLAPPGHTDFGYYTIFSHCPRYKADAPDGLDAEVCCPVCGNGYRPSDTHSMTEMHLGTEDS
jgi:hypothetical protein